MKPITSRFALLDVSDIDTDQIIPARFLTTTERSGLGRALFADWRENPGFVLNQPAAQGASILATDQNFGCGSSREHAAWALLDYGFKAVLSPRFADIFRNNALKNGVLPIVISPEALDWLRAHPNAELTIDLEHQSVQADGFRETFEIDAFARYRIAQGVDELGYLLAQADAITHFEEARAA
jgi:3-isopropylmalate/(R)-2-methylmalate dehydratase small subunit